MCDLRLTMAGNRHDMVGKSGDTCIHGDVSKFKYDDFINMNLAFS